MDSLDSRLDYPGLFNRVEAVEVTTDHVRVFGYLRFLGDRFYVVALDRRTESVEKTTFSDPWEIGDVLATIVTLGGYTLLKSYKERRRQMREYKQNVARVQAANTADAETKIAPIAVYQGDLDEVERILGHPLEHVDTGNPTQFLHVDDLFLLRAQAYLLGADAVIHYAPGSATGTPVRFADKQP